MYNTLILKILIKNFKFNTLNSRKNEQHNIFIFIKTQILNL